MISNEDLATRCTALSVAKDFVAPIAELYPPEAYKIVSQSAGPFTTSPNTTMTPAEQVVGMMINIADWILDTDGEERRV